MWERFSDLARRVVIRAQEEAANLGAEYFEPEHLLLGLMQEPEALGVRALIRCGVDPSRVRSEIETQVERNPESEGVSPRLGPATKEVLTLALKEAKHLGHNYAGTEHLLLGLIGHGSGLAEFGVELGTVRQEVAECLQ